MKKPVSILLAAVIAASALAAAPFAAHAAQYGDVDGDGLVTVVDATIIQKHSARLTTLDSSLLKAADMNGDGKVNVVDATNVQKVAAGIDEPSEIMPEVSDDDLKNEGSLAMNRFGVKLLQNSEIKDKNVLISPLSVMYALGMASNGAGGSTLHQMESTMGMSLDTMNRYFKAYPSYLSQDENAKLSIADSVWFNTLSQNIALRDSFTNAVRENYAAEVAALPFDHKAEDQINAWVNEKTGGMIPSVIKDIDTLADVFGADAAKYMVPNRSMFVAPADTPDDICAAIAKVIDKIDEEPAGSEFYDRCRVNGGTSKYYTWPGDEIMAEWGRLDPVIKDIVEMG